MVSMLFMLCYIILILVKVATDASPEGRLWCKCALLDLAGGSPSQLGSLHLTAIRSSMDSFIQNMATNLL